jgi:diacylglycerol kinase (ATP)
VRAAAILHSYVKADVVEPFCDARVNVFLGNMLEPDDLPDVVLVFGGDGAVNRVLPSLASSGVPLLVVPCGSANDFAHCLGIQSVADALRAWRCFLGGGGNVRTLDLGTVRPMAEPAPEPGPEMDSRSSSAADGRIAPPEQLGPLIMRHHLRRVEASAEIQRTIYFSGIAGIGLDAETNRVADAMPGWLRRHGGYMIAVLCALASYQPPRVRLHCFAIDGAETQLSGPVLFASAGNTPIYGSGIRMLPRAKMDDGQLDLCFVPQMPTGKVLRNIHKIYSGTHLDVDEVQYLRAVQVFVESDAPMDIWADGERLCQTPAEIAVSAQSLRVIVPS